MRSLEFARRWWVVAAGVVLGIVAGLVLVAVTPKVYTSTATLFVGSPVSTDASVAYNLDQYSQQRALTYSKLAQSRDIAVTVIGDLGLDITPQELSAKVSASPVLKTVLMNISATDGSPQVATDIANAFATDFTKYVTQLETPIGSNQPSTVVTVVQKADPPSSPTSPNTGLNVLAGLIAGLVLGFFAKWLMRILDRRVRTSEQVAESTGVPVLGVLPRDSARRSRRLDPDKDSNTAYAEALRKLRANLLYADVDAPPKSIAFVAPTSTVSTTATATNLAVVFDKTGRHVGLIDADMRESRVHRYIGESDIVAAKGGGGGAHDTSQVQGLSTVLSGQAVISDAILGVAHTNIDVLFAGPPSKTAGEMLASEALPKLVAEFRNNCDFVFCDTPGLLATTDAAEIGRACDGVVLVATQGKTRIDRLSATAETLRSLGAKVIGAVLTEAH